MRKRRPKGILDRMRLWKAVFLLGVSFLFYLLVLSPHGGAVKEYSARAIAVLKEKVGQRVSPPARNAPLRAQSNTTTLGLPTDLYPNSPHIGKLLRQFRWGLITPRFILRVAFRSKGRLPRIKGHQRGIGLKIRQNMVQH